MKQIFLFSYILFQFAFAVKAQEAGLDEILAKYYKNSGFDKMQNVKTIVMTGTLLQQDAMPLKIIRKRPDKYMMEFDVQDKTAYQVYDGKNAWMTAPWTPNPKPQLMPEDRAKDIRSKADFDGTLFNWKTKGHLAELQGLEPIGERKAYKIKLTRADGALEYYYIDSENFLLVKKSSFRKMQGQEVEMENYLKDYRNIQGIMFPFESENTLGGNPYNTIQYDTIEVDVPVDDSRFAFPSEPDQQRK